MYKNFTDLIPNVYIPLGLWSGLGAGLEDFSVGKEKRLDAILQKTRCERRGSGSSTTLGLSERDFGGKVMHFGEIVMPAMYPPVYLTGSCIIDTNALYHYC